MKKLMEKTALWNRMWGDTKFVPAGSSTEYDSITGERIAELERRVKVLEMRLSKLTNI
jgi:hypothetical protein